jgi:putative membrane protein
MYKSPITRIRSATATERAAGGGLMSVTTLLFWALLITGVDVLVRYLNKGTPTGDRGSVERILAERYARGDIDDEEYCQRLRVLHGRGAQQ